MPDPQTIFLAFGGIPAHLLAIGFSEEEATTKLSDAEKEAAELIEWPIAPLRTLCGAGAFEHAFSLVSTDSAELGKVGSMDTLLEIELAVRSRDGWECLSVLPGQFGQNVWPPCITMVWKRAKRLVHPGVWSGERNVPVANLHADFWQSQLDALGVKPISSFTLEPQGPVTHSWETHPTPEGHHHPIAPDNKTETP